MSATETSPGAANATVTGARNEEFLDALESGALRAAVRDPSSPTGWRVDREVKRGVLACFAASAETEVSAGPFLFRDRDLLLPRRDLPASVRVVPGGTAIRRGAHLGKGVVVMPPAYVNVGAFVDEDSLVDSHALVGSCAQVGKRVHLSAAAQIGGVLEPIGALPVIVEDDVFVGGNCGIYEGVVVKRRAVLAAGVILTSSTPVYDLTRGEILRSDPSNGVPLVIPEGAVVVMGSRPAPGDFAREHGLSLAAPVIVKIRDAKTDAKTTLEAALRR
ncbi:MAG TPA: 2,3,4,5-tetrahydropyridine-2,6-dicarboxylate N-succinyltransferase [Thermoanaerobaculia bacterium]|nr:2,3,4,5-tetrahydropyridine-2,6-dicarboxylate N-succinyltransferase [Thermoanaerobaculia bacterium]